MKMVKKTIAALFDLDGVVFDTETQYDVFWKTQGTAYNPGIPDFNKLIKGSTLKQILDTYFPDPRQQQQICEDVVVFERNMTFSFIPGFMGFLTDLKKNGAKVAIVTSSDDTKMANVYRSHPDFAALFDSIVTADKITRSKPDPECYLLAARELGVPPEQAYVFEDSFAGLESGRRAGMTVVGVATTNSVEAITASSDRVITDFTGLTFAGLMDIKKA